mmetsp:Transcript_52100/g.86214  ORF Transcript_52100/g.86214 Transcript_52100/m.86214 type:complete len:223 (-) Transcript_52100:365-1033(-)
MLRIAPYLVNVERKILFDRRWPRARLAAEATHILGKKQKNVKVGHSLLQGAYDTHGHRQKLRQKEEHHTAENDQDAERDVPVEQCPHLLRISIQLVFLLQIQQSLLHTPCFIPKHAQRNHARKSIGEIPITEANLAFLAQFSEAKTVIGKGTDGDVIMQHKTGHHPLRDKRNEDYGHRHPQRDLKHQNVEGQRGAQHQERVQKILVERDSHHDKLKPDSAVH